MEIERAKEILREIFREVTKYGVPLNKKIADAYQCLGGDTIELLEEADKVVVASSEVLMSREEAEYLVMKAN